jgi:hypothetical protein
VVCPSDANSVWCYDFNEQLGLGGSVTKRHTVYMVFFIAVPRYGYELRIF